MKLFAVLMVIATMLVSAIGWVLNLIKVIDLFVNHAEVGTTLIVRVIGVPIPIIGAIVGWL